jgi:hypothetical protein
MKKIALLVFIYFISNFGFSQNKSDELIPFYKNKLWGFSSTDGVIKIQCIYQEVDFFSSDSIAKVKKNGKYGFINNQGKEIIPISYDNCYRIYDIHVGNSSHRFNFNPLIHSEKSLEYPDSENQQYIVTKNKLKGVIKLESRKVVSIIPITYKEIKFDIGRKVYICMKSSAYEYINKKGLKISKEDYLKIQLEESYGIGFDTENPAFEYKIAGKVGLKKKDNYYGKEIVIIPAEYDSIYFDKNSINNWEYDFFIAQKDRKWGALNGKNQILIDFKFDSINFKMSNKSYGGTKYSNKYFAMKDRNWGILGRNYNSSVTDTILPFNYNKISELYHNYCLIERNNQFEVFSLSKTEIITKKAYKKIDVFKYESVKGFYIFQVSHADGTTVYLGENGIEFFSE